MRGRERRSWAGPGLPAVNADRPTPDGEVVRRCGSHYAAEFDDIFRRRRAPQQPTVYVCAQDRDDSATALESERFAAADQFKQTWNPA